jgi:hypothetical protein
MDPVERDAIYSKYAAFSDEQTDSLCEKYQEKFQSFPLIPVPSGLGPWQLYLLDTAISREKAVDEEKDDWFESQNLPANVVI